MKACDRDIYVKIRQQMSGVVMSDGQFGRAVNHWQAWMPIGGMGNHYADHKAFRRTSWLGDRVMNGGM